MTGGNEERPAFVMLAAGMATRYRGGCKPLAPVGQHGEAVIDLNASDALSAGFGRVVVVVGPHSGPAIAYHIERCWPGAVDVALADQTVPLGTAHATLCARPLVGDRRFALVNADDVYGVEALHTLCRHLAETAEHANVAYRLADTVVSDDPVTRGTATAGPDGLLAEMVERKKVRRQPDGSFVAEDGKQPARLDAATPVSVNLWGFQPAVWPLVETAVRRAHGAVAADGTIHGELDDEAEVLLPEVIGAMVRGEHPGLERPQPVRVLRAPGRTVGVTHQEDLPLVRTQLAAMVGAGTRAARLWTAVG